ncbi:Hypothetical predicted protein [Pelobates cultripes]|uniref:Hydrocephalus-inducing protein homolog n=1 Tax=Pelobates cultripes TaxID=61616 RepID=A0AAD1TET7_PELCU|nr:Hypothetical predicted protein [Pelobates cultripes]
MPSSKLQGPVNSLQDLSVNLSSGLQTRVVPPQNPKMTRDEGARLTLTPSAFLREMSLSTEQKLANTKVMYPPRIIELLDMSETSHQKFSSVDLDQALFQPFPSEIVFQNYVPFNTYEVPLVLRNNDKVPRLVKVIQESSPYFQIISPNDVCNKVAPGMPSTFRIMFTPEENKDYFHEVICITEREKFLVPIRAVGARAMLDFPDQLSFQVCPVKYNSQKTLLVRNIGNREACFQLHTQRPFSVDPVSGTLGVGESMQVTVNFHPQDLGDHVQDLIIHYDTGEDIRVSLYGASSDINVRLDKNSLIVEKTFLSLANQRTVTIINRSDIITHFQWKALATAQEEEQQKLRFCSDLHTEEEEESDSFLQECSADPSLRERLSLLSRTFHNRRRMVQADAMLFTDDIFHIEPMEGDIWPNSSVEIRVLFKPREAKLYQRVIYCDITGRESRLPLRIRGEGLGPKLLFNFDKLDIGKIFVGSTHSYEVILTNHGAIDGIFTINQPSTAVGSFFMFEPNEGIVLPAGHQAIQISVCCGILGEFSQEFEFTVDGLPEVLKLTIQGCVIGPTFHFSVPSLHFGDVPFGFPQTLMCSLCNTSLVPMTFNLRIPGDGNGEPSVTSTSQILQDTRSSWRQPSHRGTRPQEFSITPSQGTIRSQGCLDIKVTLCSNQVKKYDVALVVDVDGIGEEVLALPIIARCLVPSLCLEDPVLKFNRCFIHYPYQKTVTLINPSSLPGCYCVLPQEADSTSTIRYYSPAARGIVGPESSVNVSIIVEAQTVGEQIINARIAVYGSAEPLLELELVCIGEGPVVHVSPSEMDFGNIQVLTDVSKTLHLCNQSPISAPYKASMARKRSPWRIEPSQGEVPANGEVRLTLITHLDDTVSFTDNVQLFIANSNTYHIPMRAVGIGTTIVTDRAFAPVLNLGSHFSSGPCRYHFTMTNQGRRTHQLYWMTEGFPQFRKRPQLPSLKSGTLNPELPFPVFKLNPSRMELHPGESIDVTLEGSSDVPKVVKERLLGQAIIGRQSGKEKIMTVDVICEFIAPILQLSAGNLHFYLEKKPDDVLEAQCKSLTMKNISSLPLTIFLSLSPPFSIYCKDTGQDADVQEAHRLEVGEEKELTVCFDPIYVNDHLSRVIEEVLTIRYAEHPHTDCVSLQGEVHFPNLHFPFAEIHFGCILNDTESTQDLQVTNSSPFPIQYRWFYRTEPWQSHSRENLLQEPKEGDGIEMELSGDHCRERQVVTPEAGTEGLTGPGLSVSSLSEREERVPTGVEEVFDILPMFGNLEPGESQTVSFTFYGHAGIRAHALALCEVHGGPTYEISLHGEASLVSYTLSATDIDYGIQPFDKVAEADIILRNTGLVSFPFTVFNSTMSLQPGKPLIQPLSGHIAAGGEKILKVSYFPGLPEPFHQVIQLQVAHLEPESIEIQGEGVFPRICLDLPRVINENERLQPYLREAEKRIRETAISNSCLTPNLESPREQCDSTMDTLVQMELECLLLKEHVQEELTLECPGDPGHRAWSKLLRVFLPEYVLDLGFVILGEIRTHIIKITNTGHFPVSFHADRRGLIGTGFSTELDRVKNLPCGQTEIFQVKFDPRGANLSLGQVEVVMPIQVSGGPTFPVRLMASVTMPCLRVSCDSVEFDPVQCGQCQIRSIQLYNQFPVPCEWSIRKEDQEVKIDKHIPMHLRKKCRPEVKPKAPIFEMIPATDVLLPGQKKNVEIKFLPREEKLYSQRLVLHLAQSNQRVLLHVLGQGLEPRLEFSPSVLEMGPILPLSPGDAMDILVRNPCSFPIEFYSLEMDKQYREEEKILRTLTCYDSHKTLLLPPRLPGEKLPLEILEYYDENRPLLVEETENLKSGAGAEADPYSDPEKNKQNPEPLRALSAASDGESHSSEGKLEFAESELEKKALSGKVPDSVRKAVGDLEYNPVTQAIARYMGIDTSSEGRAAANRRGIAIIMHGSPLTGKSSAAVALAQHYGIACLSIDSVVLEAISDGNSPAGLRARQLCSKASLEQVLRQSEESALQAVDGSGQSRLSVEALAKHTAEGGQGLETKMAPQSIISRSNRGNLGQGKSKSDLHLVQGAKHLHLPEPLGSQTGSSPLPPGPAQQRLSVSASVGGELGLVSCVLPEDLLQDILSERLQLNDCFRGVVFDGLDTLFARSSPSALQIVLKALNNRRHIYFINLHQEYSAMRAREQAQKLQDEQEKLRMQAQEKAYLEEMDEDAYDNLPDDERARVDRLRLDALRERKKREKEEHQAREECERKLQEELLKQREEEELRKKTRRGRSRDSDFGGKKSQMGIKQPTNQLNLKPDQRLDFGMDKKVSLKERPESVLNENEDASKRSKSKDPVPHVTLLDDLEKDLGTDSDKQLVQRFRNYESCQKDILHILTFWDRVKGTLLSPVVDDSQRLAEEQSAERQAPSGKKHRKDRERERQEKAEKDRIEKERAEKERMDRLKTIDQDSSTHSPLDTEAQEPRETALSTETGVPVFEFQVLGSHDASDQTILQSGKLPLVEEILDGLGLGPSGPPCPPPCYFSVVQFPEKRAVSTNLESLSHFTFIAASPDDPNVIVEEKKESDPPEAEPVLTIPTPKYLFLKDDQLTPTKGRNKKERSVDTGRESQKDKRRPASTRKNLPVVDILSPPPGAGTPVSDVDQGSITGEVPLSKLQRLGIFRWVVPAGGEVFLRIHFASTVIGNFDQTMNFEVLGTCRRYQLYCRGVCAFPAICQDPKLIFPQCKKEMKADEICQKKFILSSGVFEFGPLLCGKARERYKAGQFPENMETIMICNVSPIESEINFGFQHDMKATTFILDPPTMTLKPNEKQVLSIWAYPTSPGVFEDNIVCCIKDNPLPALFRISCRGVRPELELDRKHIHFDKVLLHRKDSRTIFLRNSNLLPAAWRVIGLENLGDEFSVSQDQGIVGPRSQYGLQVHFKAAKATNVKKFIRLEVSDVENILGIVQLETIQVLAEAYDVSLDISFPKGTDGGLDFGVVKVNDEVKHTISLKNKGKYEIGFSFSLEGTGPGMVDLNSIFSVTPQKGPLAPNDRSTQVQIHFQSKREVEIVDKPILRCQVIEPSLSEGGETIASIPIRVSVRSVFSKYRISPSSDINFGAMVLGSRKLCSFTLENLSQLEFRYSISKLIREVIIQPVKKGSRLSFCWDDHSVLRVRSREGSGSSKSVSFNKAKRTDSQMRDISTTGQARLTLGMFTVSPGFGTVSPGTHQTINVDCFAEQLGRCEELLSIDISDRDPEDHSNGVPFRLVTEVCTPGFVTDDIGSIFEEHRIVTDTRILQCLPSLLTGGVYLQEENRFLFCNVIVGQSYTARFKIINSGKVPCDVTLALKPSSAKEEVVWGTASSYRVNDMFEIEPQRMNIPSHSQCFASVTFSPQSMMLYQCIFEASVEGISSVLSKARNLTFEINGEGILPRITVTRPALRNKRGHPLLLYQRLLIGQHQQLPLVLKNEGSIAAKVNIDLTGEEHVFTLKPKPDTQCIYPAWTENNTQNMGQRAHTASLIIHPGHTAQFDVVFHPADPQRFEATLHLSVMDNQYDQICVQLVGEGYKDDITIDNIQNPGVALSPQGSVDEDVVEAPRMDHIIFGDCYIGLPYQVTFTMTNHSQLDAMRFEWPLEGPLNFSPQVGHIHASCAKHVAVTLKSDVPLTLSKSPVKCRVSRISFPLPLDQIPDWDDRMRTVKWVDNAKVLNGQHPTKRKVIETDPEPSHVVIDGGNRDLELLVSAVVDHAQYVANCDLVQFKDTLLYQTRVYKFHMQNTGSVQLHFSWQVRMEAQDQGFQISPRPVGMQEPLGSARTSSSDSRPPSVIESVSSMLSVGPDAVAFSVQPSSGLIPAGETQEFLIKFSPLSVGEFGGCLTCRIPNLRKDQQELVLPVKGCSMLPYCHFQLEDSDYITNRRRNPELGGPRGAPSGTTLDPNTRVIEFSSVGVRTKNTRKFCILNPTSSPYSFLWTCDDPSCFQSSLAFRCLSEQGVIQPEKKVEVTFEFVPQVTGITESFWSFTIPEQNIVVPFLLVGKASEPCVSLDRSHLNFGSLLVDHEVQENLYLINNEDKPITFSIRESSCYSEGHGQGLMVKPMGATIAPLSRIPLRIAMKPTQAGSVNFRLICDVQTMTEALYLNVKAEGHSTAAYFQYQDSTGNITSLSLQGPNKIDLGQVDINDRSMLQFNVLNNGRFPFSYSCSLSAPQGLRDYLSISPTSACVESGQKALSLFTFQPTRKCILKDTELQIKVEAGPELRCCFNATVVRPGIHFSFKRHNFGNCFIYQVGMHPVRKTLVIINKDDREISLDCLYSNTAHLEVDFHSDVLCPGEKVEIPITFYPRAGLLYQEAVVFQMNSHSQQLIHIQGQGIEMKVEVANPKHKVTNFGAVRVGETVKKSIPIVNNSMSPITCTFTLSPNTPVLQDHEVLLLSPSSEVTIPPQGGMCKLEMRFRPTCRIAPFTEEVMFEVAGIMHSLLVLRGSSQGLELSFDQEYISFGAVVLQSQATRRIILNNTGELGARFQWNAKMFQPDFSISPVSGYITAGTDVTFEVVFHPREINTDIRYENLSCLIEGNKTLNLTLSGSCIGPPATKEVISFQCPVRNKQTQSILLTNKTSHAWNLQPVIDGEHWKGAETLRVDAHQQNRPYDITYCPLTMSSEGKKHQGSIFFPLPDGTGLMYLLQGVSEPPKSSGNVIREVPCKTSYTELLHVRNWLPKTQRFRVVVDMVKPERLDSTTTIKGLDYLEVPGAAKRDYKLSFHSHKEGTFSTKVRPTHDISRMPTRSSDTLLESAALSHTLNTVRCNPFVHHTGLYWYRTTMSA